MNVLLVDDEPLELEQLEFLIQPHFPLWKIFKASDSSQALSISQEIKLQLAFLDVLLPGKNGLELGVELKRMHKDIDIIIVTAFQDFGYAKQSIKLGVVDYITKPLIESELLEVLKKYSKNSSHQRYSQITNRVLSIVHERYEEKLNLVDIATEIHVNPSYLSRKFHEETGTSFSEYLVQYRVEMAKKFMTIHYDWSFSQIAEKTGFNSQHYFSTIFRKLVGMTPKEYREKRK